MADFVIVTNDNPRTERPEGIIKEIVTTAGKPSGTAATASAIAAISIRNISFP